MQPLDARDLQLLDRWQRGFPLLPAPFAAVAREEGREEADILAALARLGEIGVLSRVGAVVRPNTAGASLLAAMRVAPDQLERVAAIVNAEPGVNHNYEREHAYNLWFVAAAPDRSALDAALAAIGEATRLTPLVLPLVAEYWIDLGFDLRQAHATNAGGAATRGGTRGQAANVVLDDADRRIVAALESGLPMVAEPFAAIAADAGVSEDALLARLREWLAQGVIRRFGVVVRHRALGYTANAMCVWDVPDEGADALGAELAREPGVTLCYRRTRVLPAWPYNVFCMLHGRDRASVDARRGEIVAAHGLDRFASAVLYSRRAFKQCGARYASQPVAPPASAASTVAA